MFPSCPSLVPYAILAFRPRALSCPNGAWGMVDCVGLPGAIVMRDVCLLMWTDSCQSRLYGLKLVLKYAIGRRSYTEQYN